MPLLHHDQERHSLKLYITSEVTTISSLSPFIFQWIVPLSLLKQKEIVPFLTLIFWSWYESEWFLIRYKGTHSPRFIYSLRAWEIFVWLTLVLQTKCQKYVHPCSLTISVTDVIFITFFPLITTSFTKRIALSLKRLSLSSNSLSLLLYINIYIYISEALNLQEPYLVRTLEFPPPTLITYATRPPPWLQIESQLVTAIIVRIRFTHISQGILF